LPRLLDSEVLGFLRGKRLLLAFSHGVDSTALFYLLNSQNLDFALAFVNYNTRENSSLEEKSARELAKKFNKKIFVKSLEFDLNSGDFERRAREARYEFFKQICTEFGYEILLTAHQLNDLFEWFLMRFSKGAGLCNLIGMRKIDDFGEFKIARPLLFTPKFELENYLKSQKIEYFEDASNFDTKFERNRVRMEFGNKFIHDYSHGIAKSFEFLMRDYEALLDFLIYENRGFYLLEKRKGWENAADKIMKKFGTVLSQNERRKLEKSCVINGICVAQNEKFIFIHARSQAVLPKKFKEFCRINDIPAKSRPFLYQNMDILRDLCELKICGNITS